MYLVSDLPEAGVHSPVRRTDCTLEPAGEDLWDLVAGENVVNLKSFTQMKRKTIGRGVIAFIIASVGINAVVEMIVAAVVTGAVGAALKKARLI